MFIFCPLCVRSIGLELKWCLFFVFITAGPVIHNIIVTVLAVTVVVVATIAFIFYRYAVAHGT